MLAPLLAILLLASQTPVLHPNAPDQSKPPIVSFDFVLPGAEPGHYSIAIDSAGRAAYLSQDVPTPGAQPGEAYTVKYVISEPTRARIFALADQLSHFEGDFEYHGGRVANMGAKTLTWSNGEKQSSTTFNYSTNPQIQELTRIFEEISTTIEHGRRIEFLLRFDKLGLDAELKSLQDDAARNALGELQLLQPALQKLASDTSLMHITRMRAQKLLATIRSNPAFRQVAPQ